MRSLTMLATLAAMAVVLFVGCAAPRHAVPLRDGLGGCDTCKPHYP